MWGRRIIVGALAWLMLSAQAPEPVPRNGSQPESGDGAQTQPAKHSNVAVSAARPLGARNAQPDDPEKREERKRADSDLKAQWQMAQWTMIMGLVAVAALILSLIGVGLIFLTFKATREAAKSATNTYQAFVNVERGRTVISGEYPFSLAELVMEAKATISNIGRSSVVVTCARYWANPGCDFTDNFKAEVRIDRALNPGQSEIVTIALFDLKKINEAPFLGGYVEYKTAFGDIHRSYFLLNLGSWEEGQGFMRFKDHPYIDRESRKRFGWPDDT